ncbi:sigma-E processing peptidase SpoIIGA [Bacillus sp. REN10]|uniref:sigma-E processing peptidase SpoIIGA n=1 Tax=Bacillus sp. REN10 TaxID=2782541 RepID=UPI00193B0A40|nr:sigma-E processing peptidase SpoIIGA [Bacillus sp. REN10]
MTLYLDALWLLNFLADCLLLWMSAIFLKRSAKWYRLILGGLLGSLSVFFIISPWTEFTGHPLSKLALSIGMVLVTYGFKRWKFFFANLMALYFSTFLTGGMLLGAHYFIQFDMQLESDMFLAGLRGVGDPVSWIFVMFGFPLAWYFAKNRMEDFQTAQIQYDQLLEVAIEINGVVLNVKGLVDTGNQLQDPISKMPVMFVSTQGLEDQLPTEVIEGANQIERLFTDELGLPSEWMDKMRIIPAKSVGKAQQLLLAFKPDKVQISNGHKQIELNKVLMSFTAVPLSSDDQFSCILHPKMVLPLSYEEVS